MSGVTMGGLGLPGTFVMKQLSGVTMGGLGTAWDRYEEGFLLNR